MWTNVTIFHHICNWLWGGRLDFFLPACLLVYFVHLFIRREYILSTSSVQSSGLSAMNKTVPASKNFLIYNFIFNHHSTLLNFRLLDHHFKCWVNVDWCWSYGLKYNCLKYIRQFLKAKFRKSITYLYISTGFT